MNPAEVLGLIKNILLHPEKGWSQIKQFNYSWQQIYIYVTIPLVCIGSFAGLFLSGETIIKQLEISPNVLLFVSIISSLLAIALGAYLITMLAPRFVSKADFNYTVALITFSYTPFYLANIISALHNALIFVNYVGIFYMVILFFRGTIVLLETPSHKITGFTIVNMIILFAVRIIVSVMILAFVVLTFTDFQPVQ